MYHFIDLALVNAFILFKEKGPMTLVDFKLEVALSLMYGENFSNPDNINLAVMRQNIEVTLAQNGDPIGGEVSDFVRYDGRNHLPELVASKGRTCKLRAARSGQCTGARSAVCTSASRKDRTALRSFTLRKGAE